LGSDFIRERRSWKVIVSKRQAEHVDRIKAIIVLTVVVIFLSHSADSQIM
jgi:hypothetical protein